MSNTTNTVLFGTYTNKNTANVDAPALMYDTQLTNEINNLRKGLGLTSVRNAYPWWTYTLVALTYFPKGQLQSMIDIDAFLQDAKIKVRNLRQHSTLLNNSIEGQSPCKIRREYAGKLPKLVRLLKLRSERMKSFYGRGRKPIGFTFNNPDEAREVLLTSYPDTRFLFNQLDYTCSTGQLDRYLP